MVSWRQNWWSCVWYLNQIVVLFLLSIFVVDRFFVEEHPRQLQTIEANKLRWHPFEVAMIYRPISFLSEDLQKSFQLRKQRSMLVEHTYQKLEHLDYSEFRGPSRNFWCKFNEKLKSCEDDSHFYDIVSSSNFI